MIKKDYPLNENTLEEEKEIISLRPKSLSEYIGQDRIVETLKIAIEAALKRKEPLEHILFNGPPGLGKTTLAHIIANEMGTRIITSSGPALEKGGDLLGLLTHMERGDIFFIDEIHRIPKVVEEFLYPAMEDFAVDFIFDKGVHARTHRYRLEQFTLIGATTRAGLLSSPLRERFGITRDLDFYNEKDLAKIIKRSAKIINITIDEGGAYEIAKRARGTPRVANRLLKRVRDYAQVKADGVITKEVAIDALTLEGIDDFGLGDIDRRLLETIIINYKGGPVGIEALSATLQLESDVLIEVIEPYLLKTGFIIRTSQGRKATEKAYKHLHMNIKQKDKTPLF
ncbi:MAG TPA: Holliday junction branch migration DNA helicase RuvB [Syntrophorhabdaceae bacterium]|nr:Holliday junction branch migration DNA helicase RuvB [Syntrophorhabdaceae bacterium]HPU29797.1 Holliday junction branch migration DNA helicase RuvB [Syntrophorhabdaceae bacterium]